MAEGYHGCTRNSRISFIKKLVFLEAKSRNELPKRSREVLTEHKPKLRNWKGNNKGFSNYHDSKRFLLVRYDLWTTRSPNLGKRSLGMWKKQNQGTLEQTYASPDRMPLTVMMEPPDVCSVTCHSECTAFILFT